jgi:hypothetical protein
MVRAVTGLKPWAASLGKMSSLAQCRVEGALCQLHHNKFEAGQFLTKSGWLVDTPEITRRS